jgi:hypothetical protein
MENKLPTQERRFGTFKVDKILKTETSLPGRDTERSTSNSISFMLIKSNVLQERVNSTRDSVSTLKEHSTLFHI